MFRKRVPTEATPESIGRAVDGAALRGSVALQTSVGTLLVALYGLDVPEMAKNFSALCSLGFYNGTYVRRVVRGSHLEIAPHDECGEYTAFGLATGSPRHLVPAELSMRMSGAAAPAAVAQPSPQGVDLGRGSMAVHPGSVTMTSNGFCSNRVCKFDRAGIVAMRLHKDTSSGGDGVAASFIITLPTTKRLASLEAQCVPIGEVIDGLAALRKINAAALQRPLPNPIAPFLTPAERQGLYGYVDETDEDAVAAAAARNYANDGAPVKLVRIRRAVVIDDLNWGLIETSAPSAYGPRPGGKIMGPPRRSPEEQEIAAAAATFSMAAFMKRCRERCLAPSATVAAECPEGSLGPDGLPHPPICLDDRNDAAKGDSAVDANDAHETLYNVETSYGYLSSGDDDGSISITAAGGGSAGPGDGAAAGSTSIAAERAQMSALQRQAREARVQRTHALMLRVMGELPDVDAVAPDNVLFVCKLNPMTEDADLATCFAQFGKIVSCEIVRDKRTNQSLQYAFIEFDSKLSCERAYGKMDNVLIDEFRIHVDFSQSVSGAWAAHRRKVDGEQPDRKKGRPEEH